MAALLPKWRMPMIESGVNHNALFVAHSSVLFGMHVPSSLGRALILIEKDVLKRLQGEESIARFRD
jgi:hypothetical protein